jgi:hypothetical protein
VKVEFVVVPGTCLEISIVGRPGHGTLSSQAVGLPTR